MSKTEVPLKLVGEDGNAFSILGRAQKALQGAGLDDLVPTYMEEATAGDYNHLLQTTMEWFDVDGGSNDEFEETNLEECLCCNTYTDDVYCTDCANGFCPECSEDE